MDNSRLCKHYLEDAIASFRAYKKLAEKALDQLKDDEYFVTIDAESNSVAVIMKHIAGNMFSRWKDFLTSDGEKPNRNRDAEFVIDADMTKESLREHWERGWACLFAALEPLRPADFEKKVLIRGEEHTIVTLDRLPFSPSTFGRPTGNRSAFHAIARQNSISIWKTNRTRRRILKVVSIRAERSRKVHQEQRIKRRGI